MMQMDLIAGAQAAADYLGISRNSIYHLVRHGHLPVIRKGRAMYFRKHELEAAFQSEVATAEAA